MPHAKRGDTAPPKAAKRPHESHAHGVTWRRRLCLDPRRQLARGAARSRHAARRISARCSRRRTPTPSAMLGADAQLCRSQLVREMRARLKEDDSEVPQADGPYAYYSRFRHGGQHRIFCRKPREGGKETRPARRRRARRRQEPSSSLIIARHSPDHRKLAWSADDKGSEMFAIARARHRRRSRSCRSRRATRPAMSSGRATSLAFLYVALDENHRPWRVMLHRLGTPSSEDVADFRGGRSRLVHRHRADAARPRRRSSPCMATTPRKRTSSISTIPPRRRA